MTSSKQLTSKQTHHVQGQLELLLMPYVVKRRGHRHIRYLRLPPYAKIIREPDGSYLIDQIDLIDGLWMQHEKLTNLPQTPEAS
jgi:hypothetical protein